jgi:hypothetical protein
MNPRDCEHGHLARQCKECEDAAEIARLTSALAEAEKRAGDEEALHLCAAERVQELLRRAEAVERDRDALCAEVEVERRCRLANEQEMRRADTEIGALRTEVEKWKREWASVLTSAETRESALSAALKERDEVRAAVARWEEHYERETAEMDAGEDDLAALREAVEMHRLACSGRTQSGPCVLCLRPVFSAPSPSMAVRALTADEIRSILAAKSPAAGSTITEADAERLAAGTLAPSTKENDQ